MSRLLACAAAIEFLLPFPALAQHLSNTEIAALIEKQRRLVAMDEEGCLKYPDENEIVVCGAPEDEKKQRVFKEQSSDENRLRRGEAVSTKRAAACLPGDAMCRIPLPATIGVGFGYVPPPVIPLEEVMRGLPDQDQVNSASDAGRK